MPEPRPPEQYSTWVGSIYVFNLIVGTGALTLPFAFNQAGWLVSLFVIIALAYMSYVTATFVIESMATANAVIQWRRCQRLQKSQDGSFSGSETSKEETPLLESENGERPTIPTDFYSIQEKVEMGQMVSLFFHKIGVILFYCCICIYLYGDLAIYCAAVAKSLRDVTCTFVPENHSCNQTIPISERCWESLHISRQNAYRLYIGVFLLLLGPFVFFNVQKTKYLQMTTSLLRWIAFLTMIILAAVQLAKGKGKGHPSLGNTKGIPSLFGVCVYSFMCHHSLPSLVTPISNKLKIYTVFAADYIAILGFYLLLAFTGIFTFHSLHDLYTLDFQPDKCAATGDDSITDSAFIRYFLALFPVFTLSTNFPIIGITLRNNLQSLCLKENTNYSFLIRRILFPVITILPPVAIAIVSESVEFLVGFTGSYAGTGIQYIVPAILVYSSRKLAANTLGTGVKNTHKSPFRHRLWPAFVLIWAASCIIIVTINNILDIYHST